MQDIRGMDMQAALERAFVLHQDGRLAEAELLYLEVLRAAPGDFTARLLLGILRHQQGRNGEALELLTAALAIHPDSDLALLNHGNVLAALGQEREALASYDRAIALHPRHADLLNARGLLLVSQRHFRRALADLEAAVDIDPELAEAWNNRGNALQGLARLDDALASYDRALALRPAHVQTHNNRAHVLRRLGRLDEALAAARQALALDGANAQALNDRGNILQDMNRHEEAIASYDGALAIRPAYLEALNNRGAAHRDLMQFEKALGDFDRVLALDGGHALAHWSKSIVKLLTGDLEEGLRLYEWRKRLPAPIEQRSYRQPLWTGAQDIAGKTLFCYIEQGLGDTILFFRFALMAKAKGAHVILAVQDPIVQLMRDAGTDIEILDSAGAPQHFDYHSPLMSLPLAFGTTLGTIPAPGPYLRAQAQRVEKWRGRLGGHGFKIGICWQGAASIANRSFPLARLAPISQMKDVRLISLQKGDGTAQIRSAGVEIEELGDDFDSGDAFLDCAAVMESLDLVITLDTSLAHLAGALGRPAWVALKFVPDWRWFLESAQSPWYPQLRLFRQRAPGDWNSVFARMQDVLRGVLPS
jgi:tetratricopeptide (TPR) repeat protein